MRFYDETLNDNLKTAYVHENMSANQHVKVDEVQFNLNDSVKEKIEIAKREHMERYNSVEFNFMLREGFGKVDCKKAKVGPDAVMQLGFQIGMYAYLRTKDKFLKYNYIVQCCKMINFQPIYMCLVVNLLQHMSPVALLFFVMEELKLCGHLQRT